MGCLSFLLLLAALAIGGGLFAYFVAPWNFNFGGHSRGERLKLKLSGDMPRSHGADLANVPLHLYLHRIAPLATTIEGRRPHIDLWGAFGDSVLEVEDRGSIGMAFAPDGTVRTPETKAPRSAENLHITFKEVPTRALAPDCPRPAP